MKHYRIVRIGYQLCRVDHRVWWWPFWRPIYGGKSMAWSHLDARMLADRHARGLPDFFEVREVFDTGDPIPDAAYGFGPTVASKRGEA